MTDRVKDLICGMEFEKETASGSFEYQGKTYYFCSTGCKEKFASIPEKYTAHEEKAEQKRSGKK